MRCLGTLRTARIAGIAAALALSIAPVARGADVRVATHEPTRTAAEVREYWTPERMRQAEPLVAGAGTRAEPFAGAAAIPPDQEIPAELDATYPYRIHGALFLRFNGRDASCSATVITSFSRDLVLTAGHCLATPLGGGQVAWASDLLFVPAYRNGAAPFGQFPGTRSGTPLLWAFEGAISFDLGIVKLAPAAGIAIQDQLGSRGIAFNRAPRSFKRKTFQLFGYPASPEPDYDGERPILCSSAFRGFEVFSGSPVAAPCHQQQGASGGGWVQNGGIVTSLTSHAACNNPVGCDAIAGTYLGNAAFNVYSKIGGGIPRGLKKRIRRCKRKEPKKRQRCLDRIETFRPVVR